MIVLPDPCSAMQEEKNFFEKNSAHAASVWAHASRTWQKLGLAEMLSPSPANKNFSRECVRGLQKRDMAAIVSLY
jgi:hypothetical protein